MQSDPPEKDSRPLQITFKTELTKIIIAIAKHKGIDAEALIYEYISKGINRDWDFKQNKPKE